MHVPYSMRDDEPDMYGSLGGSVEDDQWEIQTRWESESRDVTYTNVRLEHVECPKFFTQEQMDKVIQYNINERHALQLEIEKLKGLLSYIYNHSEQLPKGCSQQIREALTKG